MGEVDEPGYAPDGNALRLGPWNDMTDEERSRTTAFVGHFWFGIDERLPTPSTYVTVLRDPVDRVLSLHAYRAGRGDLVIPLERYLRDGRDYEIANGQTRRLATDGPAATKGPVTQTMLDVAMENLSTRFAAVGVTERFNESVLAIGAALGWKSLGYAYANRSEPRVRAHDLDPSLRDHLVECNQFDRELHRFAGELLDRSLSDVNVAKGLRRVDRDSRRLAMRKAVRRRVYRLKKMGSAVKRTLRGTKTV